MPLWFSEAAGSLITCLEILTAPPFNHPLPFTQQFHLLKQKTSAAPRPHPVNENPPNVLRECCTSAFFPGARLSAALRHSARPHVNHHLAADVDSTPSARATSPCDGASRHTDRSPCGAGRNPLLFCVPARLGSAPHLPQEMIFNSLLLRPPSHRNKHKHPQSKQTSS